MKNFVFMGLLVLWLPLVSALAIQEPSSVVMSTAKKMMEKIAANQEKIVADPDFMYQLVNDVVIPHFDFLSMSKWVLGKKNWNVASKEEHADFVREFKILLIRTYSKTLLEYPNEMVQYITTEKRPESPFVMVKTQIFDSKNKPLPIDYRMHLRNEEWKVVDVVVDGISLVSAYHGSFGSEIEKYGFASLLQKLRERNAQ